MQFENISILEEIVFLIPKAKSNDNIIMMTVNSIKRIIFNVPCKWCHYN